MKKILFVLVVLTVGQVQALVAPEIFAYDSACPKDKPFMQVITHRGSECLSCDSLRGIMLRNPQDCQKCPNREVVNHNECRLKQCPKEKPFYESKYNWSGCKSCEDNPTHITPQECATCPNMRWVDGLDLCVPNKKGILYYNGESLEHGQMIGGMLPYTYSCDNFRNEVAIRTSQTECAYCQNTTFKDGWCYFNKKGK